LQALNFQNSKYVASDDKTAVAKPKSVAESALPFELSEALTESEH
jgi:hypothetical protein